MMRCLCGVSTLKLVLYDVVLFMWSEYIRTVAV